MKRATKIGIGLALSLLVMLTLFTVLTPTPTPTQKLTPASSTISEADGRAAMAAKYEAWKKEHPKEARAARKAEEAKIEGQQLDEKRNERAMLAEASLQRALRNPGSLQFEEAWANDDGSIICFVYRAQNGFGGMNKEFAYARNGFIHVNDGNYNRNCFHNPKVTHDVMSAVQLTQRYFQP